MKQSKLFSFFAKPASKTVDKVSIEVDSASKENVLASQANHLNSKDTGAKETVKKCLMSSPLGAVEKQREKIEARDTDAKEQKGESVVVACSASAVIVEEIEETSAVDTTERNKTVAAIVEEVEDTSAVDTQESNKTVAKSAKSMNIKDDSNDDSVTPSGLSDYERIREENIRRNAEFLASLGLEGVKPNVPATTTTGRGKSGNRKRRQAPAVVTDLPQRRSRRVASLDADQQLAIAAANKESTAMDEEEEDEEEEIVGALDDSDVMKYVLSCHANQQETNTDTVYSEPTHNPFSSFTMSDSESSANMNNSTGHGMDTKNVPRSLSMLHEEPICSDNLGGVYSLQFHPLYEDILLAAGKGGNVTIFRSPLGHVQEEDWQEKQELFSFAAHGRWVSGARFLHCDLKSSSNSSSMYVLTTSDDGKVKLWNVNRSRVSSSSSSSSHKMPELLWTSSSIHDRGIFGFDLMGTSVLTGAKDRTVCYSQVNLDGSVLTPTTQFCMHSGVVKSVSWQRCLATTHGQGYQDCKIFASGSQDRSICIKDIRSGSATSTDKPDIDLEEAHASGVHTVQFNPYGSDHLLLSGAMDPVLKVWDIRHMDNKQGPLYAFTGHVQSNKKMKYITPPAFLSDTRVVTGGEASFTLSIYGWDEGGEGRTISRGELPADPSNVTVQHTGKGIYVAAACRSDIYVLQCK